MTATEEEKLAESVEKVSISEPRLAFNQKEPRAEKKPHKGAFQPPIANGLPPPPVLSPALQTALFSSKDRKFVLSLEQDLINFIASNTVSYLLSPMNSYYRMLTHHTAAYYSLGHTLNNEGNSILVFKHIGAPLIQPYPLSLIPYDTSLQPLNPGAPIPSHFAHGQRKGSYEQVHHIHVTPPPPPPPPQHPQPFAYIPASLPPQPMLVQPQPPTIKRPSVSNEKKSGTFTPREFKLMKRKTDDKESGEEKEEKEGGETKEEDKEATPVVDPQELESERASRESLYQKARERIFQNEDDEDDDGEEEKEEEEEEEEEEEKSTNYISRGQSSPDIPRIIPHPHTPHHPQAYAYPPQPQMYPAFMSQHIQQPLIHQYYYQPQLHSQQFYQPRPQYQKRYNHRNFNTSYKQQGQPRNHNSNSYNNSNNKYTNYNPSYNQKQQPHQLPREQREQPQEQSEQDGESQESSTPPKSNESRTTV